MATNIEQLINSPGGLKVAVSIARYTPPGLGYSVARWAAGWISSRRDSGLVRAVRSNQWIVTGEKSSSRSLDQAVQAVFQNSARSLYELYHYLQNPEAVGRMYCLDPSVQMYFNRPDFDRYSVVIVGMHMIGFDLGLQWICRDKIEPLVLTIPSPEGGRRLEFEIRQKTGMNLVPGTGKGLRQAIRYLQQGGKVMTGIDRPVPGCAPQPRFFGRPAALPVHHIYLALKAQVPVVVVGSRFEQDGMYHIYASPPVEMDHYPDRADELRINAEKVLVVAEGFIRQAPQQWIMSLPVWPEMVDHASRQV